MAWEWYGVRTVHRWVPCGKPQGTDRDYSADVTLVEDRIVLVRARSFEEAIRKGEKEAKAYAAELSYRNPYGQPVKQRYLDYCDAYKLWEEPGKGVEVFSSTEVVSKTTSDSKIIDKIIGSKEPQKVNRQRRNIGNILFAGAARGVQPTEEERYEREQIERRLKRKNKE